MFKKINQTNYRKYKGRNENVRFMSYTHFKVPISM